MSKCLILLKILKMKYSSIFLLFILFIFSSCQKEIEGEGEAGIAQDFMLEKFNDVQAKGIFKLLLIENDSAYVSVQTHQNLIENINIYVQRGTLHIEEKQPVSSFESYVVYLYYNDLKKVEIQEKVLCEPADKIIQDKLELKAYGDAKFDAFDIETEELSLRAENSSSIRIKGLAKNAKFKAKNQAQINATEMRARVVDLDLAGEAEVQASIEDEIKGRVLDSSVIRYTGNPQKNIEVKDHAQVVKE